MARIIAVKEYLEKMLKDESKPWTKMFALAEEKTGIDRLYIFVGSLILLAIYLVFGLGQQLVCNIVGFVYPAYQSMKALESPKKEDDTKWLTYWVVFAVFTIVEFFSEYIVSWFPVYWLFKCVFYVWLMAPIAEYNGSLILYRRIIRPKFIQYQPGLDRFLSNARETAVKTAAEALLTNKQE
ncbi:PREDICTED: receptor expression-enhancing protein 5 [Atta cephalotes]|uniref:Receptor expression-enhancing protein n=2 Tax=Atta TaxID=12956 RepID=A0A158NHT7_ATTCE|nr:PREDICTED: receptor expression-enhancing protein 5 [Atta cephalotes]XP_018056408.1 PREDICTED: receptor expression-enhancing protein 5-like isoform X1 [Atta colombica]KYM76606.1 Receptor expression-enhancing protein 5 [Atta colombica]